ncbi:MAG: hypothetical protein KatS3mg109_1714 [Pirellulaceae bacterium]|nr:MAG: hypothetical protein KatS3mg109_1714 [Pirellulaceae bacterium]
MIVLVTTYAILRTHPRARCTGHRPPNCTRSFPHAVPSTAHLRHPAHRPTRVAYRVSSTQPHPFISPRCTGHPHLRHPAHPSARTLYRVSSTQPHTFISPRCTGHRSPTPSCAPIHAHAVPGTARLIVPVHFPTLCRAPPTYAILRTHPRARRTGHRPPTPSCAPIRAHAVPGTAHLIVPVHFPTLCRTPLTYAILRTHPRARCTGYRAPNRIRSFPHAVPGTAHLRHPAHPSTRTPCRAPPA